MNFTSTSFALNSTGLNELKAQANSMRDQEMNYLDKIESLNSDNLKMNEQNI